MPSRSRFRKWFSPNVALSFDEGRLWSANEPEGEIRCDSACLALDSATRRVLAVGDAAKALAAGPGGASNVTLVNGLGRGAVLDYDAAEARVRHELRAWRSSPWALTPRVLITAPGAETAKRALKDMLVHAGARDVITLSRVMAAALGSGLPVDGERPFVQIVLDEDWTGAGVLRRGELVAYWERPDGFEQMAAERLAARRLADDLRPVPIAQELHRLRREGIAPDDAAGRTFFLRLRERLWSELCRLDEATMRAVLEAPIWLAGSCASVSGLAECASAAWGRRVSVPAAPEAALIRGARGLLAELDWVLKATA